MLKLKQLQEAKKKAAEEEAAKKNGAAHTDATEATASTTAATTTTTTTTTTATANGAAEDKKENVFSLKTGKAGQKGKSRANAAQLRAQKDISEMDPIPGCVLSFPDPDNLMEFKVDITPSGGLYDSAKFSFTITVPPTYPYDPPKALCNTPIYHPNIDTDGKVCLNILRADWMPVLNLGSVVFGLLTLFLEPNPEDPLNKDAANEMSSRPSEFKANVQRTLRGGFHMGRHFEKLIK